MGDFTSREDEEFFAAIGRLAVAWGHVELGIDGLVLFFYRSGDGARLEPEMPRALKRKIAFLRKAIKSMPLGDDAFKGYDRLFSRIQQASELRHDIIHGAIIEQAQGSGSAKLIRAIRHGDGFSEREVTATTASILEATNEATELGGRLLSIVNQAYDLLREPSQQLDAQKPS